MSDEETFPWIAKFDRKSGVIRVPPLIMEILKIKKNKKEIFDIVVRRRRKRGEDDRTI